MAQRYFGKRKKIAGVLIENQNKGSLISKSIIGVGLNVVASNTLPMRATCINNESCAVYDPIGVLNELVRQIELYWEAIKLGHLKGLKNKYSELPCMVMKRWRLYKVDQEIVRGKSLEPTNT